MASGLESTIRLLARTPNDAAVPLLVSAFESNDPELSDSALQALLDRRSETAQKALLRRWGDLDEKHKRIIAAHPSRISTAVRDAILGTDKKLCVNGCDAVLWIGEYDLIPALIHAVEERQHVYADLAAHTMVSLAELLYRDTSTTEREVGRDAMHLRKHVVSVLQQSLERFDQHQRAEIVEAFLMLASADNPTLRNILGNPRHSSYLILLEVLKNSARPPVQQLLFDFLHDRQAPQSAINVVAHRADMQFIKQLLQAAGANPGEEIRANMRRLDNLEWAPARIQFLEALSGEEQSTLIQLVTSSGVNRLEVFEIVRQVLSEGKTAGRRAASAALAEFGGATANELTMQGLDDEDPEVQANMVSQLRHRGIPGAITRLVESIDSEHAVVQEAARESLQEFNFRRFISAYDMLDEEIRQSTGALVRRIDDEAIPLLAAELKSATRTRRLRAVDVGVAMNAIDEVEPLILEMLAESDHFLRLAAVRALGQGGGHLAEQALHRALNDSHSSVQKAAEEALEQRNRNLAKTDVVSSRLTAVFRMAEMFPDATPTGGETI